MLKTLFKHVTHVHWVCYCHWHLDCLLLPITNFVVQWHRKSTMAFPASKLSPWKKKEEGERVCVMALTWKYRSNVFWLEHHEYEIKLNKFRLNALRQFKIDGVVCLCCIWCEMWSMVEWSEWEVTVTLLIIIHVHTGWFSHSLSLGHSCEWHLIAQNNGANPFLDSINFHFNLSTPFPSISANWRIFRRLGRS